MHLGIAMGNVRDKITLRNSRRAASVRRPMFSVPCMFDSLRVKVPYPNLMEVKD